MSEKKFTIKLDALTDNLPKVLEFVDGILEEAGCSMKSQMQIDISVEEIFVNIANYAYNPKTGEAEVSVELGEDDAEVTVVLKDSGMPYNPLEKEDPDITLSAEERGIGGLGIFMTKKSMDDVIYEHKDGFNILKLKKKLK
ncbi:MAG: ATP-binding protein [Lachnospiraceae bacterium]|nr:ATP-binding protein [Lachnospiraceae bacterium]